MPNQRVNEFNPSFGMLLFVKPPMKQMNLARNFKKFGVERFSIECPKTKTKVINLANHNGHKQNREPIKTGSNYMRSLHVAVSKRGKTRRRTGESRLVLV